MTERDVGLIKDTLVFGKHENDLGWMNKAKDLAKNIEKYNILSSEENSKRLIKNMSGSEDNFFDWEKKIESITDNDEKQKHIEKRELLIAGVYIAMKGKVELSESLRSASASSVDEKLPEGLKSMGRDLVVVETKDAEILNVVNQMDVMLGHDVSESDLHSYLKLQKIHLEGLRENKEVDQKCLGRVIETVEAKMEKLESENMATEGEIIPVDGDSHRGEENKYEKRESALSLESIFQQAEVIYDSLEEVKKNLEKDGLSVEYLSEIENKFDLLESNIRQKRKDGDSISDEELKKMEKLSEDFLSGFRKMAEKVTVAITRYNIVEEIMEENTPLKASREAFSKLELEKIKSILSGKRKELEIFLQAIKNNYMKYDEKMWNLSSEDEKRDYEQEVIDSWNQEREDFNNQFEEYQRQIFDENKEKWSADDMEKWEKNRDEMSRSFEKQMRQKQNNWEKYHSLGLDIIEIPLDRNGKEIDGRIDEKNEEEFKDWLLANGFSVYKESKKSSTNFELTKDKIKKGEVDYYSLRKKFKLINSMAEILETRDSEGWFRSMEYYARAIFDELSFSEGSLFTVFMADFPKTKPPKEICDLCSGYRKMSNEKWQSIITVVNDIHNCYKAWSSAGNGGNSKEFLQRIATSIFGRDVVDMNELPGWKESLEHICSCFQESENEPSVSSILDEVFVENGNIEIRKRKLNIKEKNNLVEVIQKKARGRHKEFLKLTYQNSDEELLSAVSQIYGRKDITKPFLFQFTKEGYMDFKGKDRSTLKKEAWERFQSEIFAWAATGDEKYIDLKNLLTSSARSKMLLHVTFLSAWEYNTISGNFAMATPIEIPVPGKMDPLLQIPELEHISAGAHKGVCQYCISQLRNFWRQKKKFFPFEFYKKMEEDGRIRTETYGGDQEMYADVFGKWIMSMFLSGNVRQKAAAIEMMRDIYRFKSSFIPDRLGFNMMEFMHVMDETDRDPSEWRLISHAEAAKRRVGKIGVPKKIKEVKDMKEIPKKGTKIIKHEEEKGRVYFVYKGSTYIEYTSEDGSKKYYLSTGCDTNIYKRWATAEVDYSFRLLNLLIGKTKSRDVEEIHTILNDVMEVKLNGLPKELEFLNNTFKGDYYLFRHISKDTRIISAIMAQIEGLENYSQLILKIRSGVNEETNDYTKRLKEDYLSSGSFFGKLMNLERGNPAFIALKNKMINVFGGGIKFGLWEKSLGIWRNERGKYWNKQEVNDNFKGATVEDAVRYLDITNKGKRINNYN